VEVLATPPRQRCRREEDGGARPNGEAGVEVVAHMAAMSLVGFTGVTVATGVREGCSGLLKFGLSLNPFVVLLVIVMGQILYTKLRWCVGVI
jgi:hypothetical protein